MIKLLAAEYVWRVRRWPRSCAPRWRRIWATRGRHLQRPDPPRPCRRRAAGQPRTWDLCGPRGRRRGRPTVRDHDGLVRRRRDQARAGNRDRRAERRGARGPGMRADRAQLGRAPLGRGDAHRRVRRGLRRVPGPRHAQDDRRPARFEKAAVVAGGGTITASASTTASWSRTTISPWPARASPRRSATCVASGPDLLVEVEADDMDGVRLALAAGADGSCWTT